MAAFVLGVNGNCSHAGALREVGWSSLTKIMFQRKLKYFHRLCKMEDTYLAKAALNDCFSNIDGVELPWKVSYKVEITKIMEICQISSINKDTKWKSVIPLINKWDLDDINKQIVTKVPHSLKWLPMKFVQNGTQSYIDGSPEAQIISQFRLGRGKLKNRDSSGLKKCTLCKSTNVDLTEAHVIMSCKALTELREDCGIVNWCNKNDLNMKTDDEKLRLYLGDDGICFLKKRGENLLKMREKYLSEIEKAHERIWNSLNEIDLRQRANFDYAPIAVNGQDHPIWDSWSYRVPQDAWSWKVC